jgi:hypothetical protein
MGHTRTLTQLSSSVSLTYQTGAKKWDSCLVPTITDVEMFHTLQFLRAGVVRRGPNLRLIGQLRCLDSGRGTANSWPPTRARHASSANRSN